MFGFSVFTDVYYGMLRKYKGDSFEATKEFINTFGFEPFALLQRKSKTVKRTPYTAEGSAYMAENKEVYEYAPHTAYYHNPDNPLDEFDVASYWSWEGLGRLKRLPRGVGTIYIRQASF